MARSTGENGAPAASASGTDGADQPMATDTKIPDSTIITYRVTLELKDPTVSSPFANPSSTIGAQIKGWLVQLLLINPDANVSNINKQKVSLATFPTNEQDVLDFFLYEISTRRFRNVTLILHLETLEKFSSIKTPMMDWLKTHQIWNGQIQKCKIIKSKQFIALKKNKSVS